MVRTTLRILHFGWSVVDVPKDGILFIASHGSSNGDEDDKGMVVIQNYKGCTWLNIGLYDRKVSACLVRLKAGLKGRFRSVVNDYSSLLRAIEGSTPFCDYCCAG